MADKKSSAGVSSRLASRRKEKATEKKTEVEEKKDGEEMAVNGAEASTTNGDVAAGDGATVNGATGQEEKPEPIELPPFETITGDRIDPLHYKFQFKNVEYSSGRNKTFLCYLVDQGRSNDDLLRGYVEDEHAGAHAEEVFFQMVLPEYDPAINYTITWYVSSSPCASCAAKLAELLKSRKTMRLSIFSSRLFEWEEPEVRAGLKSLAGAGCKLRMMKPLDFSYTWDTFVEHEDQTFTPWEDCQENYEYYQEKMAEVLQ